MSKKLWEARAGGQAGGVLIKAGQMFTADAERDYSHWAVEMDKDGHPVKKEIGKAVGKASGKAAGKDAAAGKAAKEGTLENLKA